MEIRKILVPVDFSDNSKKVLDAAVFLAEKCDAAIYVVFVVQTFEDYSGFFVPHMPMIQFEEELVKSAEQKMGMFVECGDVAATKVLTGDVAEEIVGFARQEKIDMIVMGTHGYKGLEKVMFGSVADKVVRSASCPVLTINPYRHNIQ